MLIRVFDIVISSLGLLLGSPVLLIVFLLGLFDTGSPLFMQVRMGKGKRPFLLFKFRTMSKNTVSVASHLASKNSITKMGGWLRRTKIDELPQLWNVLKGDMSIVGPRPNLFNQVELIKEREALGIYDIKPGITGLAQVNGIDMSTPVLLAKVDKGMIDQMNVGVYFKYIYMTILGRGRGDGIKHI